jgi:hypothetical protein
VMIHREIEERLIPSFVAMHDRLTLPEADWARSRRKDLLPLAPAAETRGQKMHNYPMMTSL